MKSKITNKSKILMKGIVVNLVFILMLSCFLSLNVVFGDESITEVIDRNEDLFSETDRTLQSLSKDIENMINQIEELSSTFNCNDFFNKIISNNTVYISNEIELRALSIFVAEGNDCYGKTFVLTKNIAMTESLEWSPIGDTTTPFKGTFDGAGYTISGIRITQKQSYVGFIGCMENGTIKNLNISNSIINIPPEVDNVNSNDYISSTKVSYSYLGAIAGSAKNSSIINCNNNTNVSGGNFVGGIVGICFDSIINDCGNYGFIEGFIEVGGIAGQFEKITGNNISINRCTNSGRIHGICGNTGGIAGSVYGKANIENSSNNATVTISEAIIKTPYNANTNLEEIPENVGGIVGWISGKNQSDISLIKNCINTKNGKIVGYKDVGGIAGQLGGNTTGKAVAQNCINYSNNIYASDIEESEENQTALISNGGFSAGKIAGSVGIATGKTYSDGKKATTQKAIGIISNCYYTVDSNTAKDASDKTTEDKVMAYGHSEYIVNSDKLVLDQYDNTEQGYSTPNTTAYPEPGVLKVKLDGETYKYQLEKSGEFTNIPEEEIEEGEQSEENEVTRYLDFIYDENNTQLYIDNIKPEIQSVKVTNSGAPSLAIKGDTLTIKITYDEEININRLNQPILKLFNDKYATFVGVSEDRKTAVFEYTLDGTENGKITDTLKLTANISDVFENVNNYTNKQLSIDKGSDIIAIVENSSATCIITNEQYNIAYKIEGATLIGDKLYFNRNDTVKITAILGGKLTSDMTVGLIPSLMVKIDNSNKEIATTIDKVDVNNGIIVYEFPAKDYNGQISTVYLKGTDVDVTYGEEDNIKTNRLGRGTAVDFTSYNIFIDSIPPTLTVSANVSVPNENERYTEGEEIIISATTSEEINLDESVRPEFTVSFAGNNGKYNNGNVIYVETVKNTDENGKVTYTYKYKYVIQNGDEGYLQYNFANQDGKIVDIAGNETKLQGYTEETHSGDVTLEGKLTDTQKTGVSYIIYKNGTQLSNFKNNTYFATGDIIKVVAKTTNTLYSSWGSSNETITAETAPKLKINGITSDIPAKSVNNKQIVYEYTITDNDVDAQLSKLNLKTTSNLYTENAENNFETIQAGTINSTDITNANLYIHQNTSIVFDDSNIYADTTAPTVKIVAKCDFNEDGKVDKNDIKILNRFLAQLQLDRDSEINERIKARLLEDGDVNGDQEIDVDDVSALDRILSGIVDDSNKLIYKFIWSEEVDEFTNDDIIVNGGIKGSLSNPIKNNDGTVTYTIEIESNVENGNTGELQVIVEKDAVQDLVHRGNIRTEYKLNIDRKAPTVEIRANKDLVNKDDVVTYTINWSEDIYEFSEENITVINGEIVENSFSGNGTVYTVRVKSTNGNDLSVEVKDNVCTDIAGNGNIGNKHIIGVKPTVEIIPTEVENSLTNKNEITYTFTWSEEVVGFTADDITVNNGTKKATNGKILSDLTENEDGTYSCTMTIKTSVENGNTGELQVIVEEDAVCDQVGLGNVRTESVISVDKVAPTVEIRANKDLVNKDDVVTYTINWSESVIDFTADSITVTNGNIVENSFSGSGSEYTVRVKSTNGNDLSVEVKDNVCTDIAGNSNIGNKHVIGVKPTVEIIPTGVENSLTNKNEITYTFTWSEEVVGFTADDITVNNGTKKATNGKILSDLTENEDGTYSCTMTIKTSIENGNTGDLQVIVEEDAVYDLVGLGNVRTENVIRVDKQSPILISLEAFAKSNIIDEVNGEISQVKDRYREQDTITIVATFSENIENSEVPVIKLQFSDSGYAQGQVTTGTKQGNKITYTYTIDNKDKGILSVAEFTGKVKDAAGNETVVTKRELNGNTVIADSEAPTLVGITAIAPEFAYEDLLSNPGETRRYGKGIQIKFIAEFDENVYSYANRTINNITANTAPDLNFKFGSTSRKATFSKVDGKTIEYTYTIGENNNNDNGSLSFVNISGTGTKAIYDIAGNKIENVTTNLVEYLGSIKLEPNEHIVADTTAPKVTLKVTKAENSEITSLNNNYRAGTVLTITASTNDEYVYSKSGNNLSNIETDVKNALSIEFGGNAAKNGVTCKGVTYENNETVFTYEYIIKDGDMGAIQLSFAKNSYYDIALNGNAAGETDSSSLTVIADTENPYYEDQPGIEFSNGRYTVTFNEDLYYLDEDNVVRSFGDVSYAPILKFENEETEYTARVSSNVLSYTGTYVNAKPYLSTSRLCDAAGNLYSFFDQKAPGLTKIEVTSPVTGTYSQGQVVTIVATFDENITATTLPTLSLQFSKSGDAKGRVSGEIKENTITYSYTINKLDEGVLTLKDFTGTIKDLVGNETQVAKKDLQGYVITADSVAPKLTITSDVANERTNKNKIIYTFTWDETVKDFEAKDIEVLNGSKGTFTPSNNGKVYTLEVYTANEGRQIVTVPENVCTDIAGNSNTETVTMNSIVIDYTKPEVRAKVNGGNYVVDTGSKKSILKETLVVNEEISKFEYIWSSSTTTPAAGWEPLNINNIDINNDIQLETSIDKSSVGENGTSIYLYIKVTDKAGNEAVGRTNAFIVRNENITFQADITETTNSNVTVTVNYGDKGLTQNRRAGIQGISQSADPNTVILTENGKVYAEASDIAGNKVYNVFDIDNIDKTTSIEITSITKNTNDPAESVTLTVNAVCVGSQIDGYSIDNGNTWQRSNIFTVTANGTYTILVKDKTGNQANDSIEISNIRQAEDKYFRITNYTQKTENNIKYVVGISTYTNLRDFKQYIQTNMTYTIYDRNGNVVSDNDIVATNMKIRVSNGDEYILVVRGDLNSDGKADISDLSAMASYYVGKASLNTPYILAADVASNGIIDISDISALARAVVQKIRL